MKALVIKEFIDKNTRKYNKVGDTIELTAKRFEEIQSKDNFLKAIKESTAKTQKE